MPERKIWLTCNNLTLTALLCSASHLVCEQLLTYNWFCKMCDTFIFPKKHVWPQSLTVAFRLMDRNYEVLSVIINYASEFQRPALTCEEELRMLASRCSSMFISWSQRLCETGRIDVYIQCHYQAFLSPSHPKPGSIVCFMFSFTKNMGWVNRKCIRSAKNQLVGNLQIFVKSIVKLVSCKVYPD